MGSEAVPIKEYIRIAILRAELGTRDISKCCVASLRWYKLAREGEQVYCHKGFMAQKGLLNEINITYEGGVSYYCKSYRCPNGHRQDISHD